MADFDIDRFVALSGAIKLDDLDWDECRRIGITQTESRILRYMEDTETHTILYMRDLLAGHSAKSQTICDFLSVWAYEELWHGRAIKKVLEVGGWPEPPGRYTEVTETASIREAVEMVGSSFAAWCTPRFIATHMTWGAINELTAAAAYGALIARTENPVLAELLKRIVKQERKHFAFYYSQAQKRLEGDKKAQALCKFTLARFWTVVGSGVGGWDNLSFIAATLFSDEKGVNRLREAESTIQNLPGLEWFDMLTKQVDKLGRKYVKQNGPVEFWPERPSPRLQRNLAS